ncbi:hypothetical protein GTY54_01940 [Streptomyces sp. SID625]|nr:hypothetical protein [Streptomyces sp. SID625]
MPGRATDPVVDQGVPPDEFGGEVLAGAVLGGLCTGGGHLVRRGVSRVEGSELVSGGL